jgi:hypothetical protein
MYRRIIEKEWRSLDCERVDRLKMRLSRRSRVKGLR